MSKKPHTESRQENDAPTSAPYAPTDNSAQKTDLCAEYLELVKRARADYDNLKKDTEKWKAEFAVYANENLLYDMLPIMDNFIEGLAHIPESEKKENWVIGITYIKKQLEEVLKKYGVEPYGASGEPFDPHRFEAVEEVNDPEHRGGAIVKVIRYGYMLGGRVLRPGQVVISNS